MKKKLKLELALVAMLGFATIAQASLIENGSFEVGISPPSGGYRTLSAPNTNISGWTVSSGNLDWIRTYWNASDGALSLDLVGTVAGKIEQTFSTNIGEQYAVTFDMAGNPVTYKGTTQLRVEAADQHADFSFNNSGMTTSNMGWVTNSWLFTAVDTTTTLSFMSLGNYNRSGPTLDKVNVTAIIHEPLYLNAADFDKDGDVDANDLAKFSSVYGTAINKTPVSTPWSWDTLPKGYFCDNWDGERCTEKRPDYSSTSARISLLKSGTEQPENGTSDETFINASASGAFEFTTQEIVISNMFDSKWHDVLLGNSYFNTVWYPNSPIENFEVISQVDERSAPSSTTNDKSYFFSYKQDNINLTEWVDYLQSITCNFTRKIDTLVIYAHGNYINNEGLLKITGDKLYTTDLKNDNPTRNTLMRLKNIMSPNGHILLFSCNTGQDVDFIKELAALSGVYVHANSNITGNPDDEALWFNCASNSDCSDWQLDLVCPPTGDCYYE